MGLSEIYSEGDATLKNNPWNTHNLYVKDSGRKRWRNCKIRWAISSERWKIKCQRESIINAGKEKYRSRDEECS